MVFDEVVVAGDSLVGSAEVRAAVWLEIHDAAPDASLLERLDIGEAAAIPLATRLGATLLCDDADGRAVGRARGLPVIGSLGVLLLGKQEGYLTTIAPVIHRMAGLGMYVSERVVQRVLASAGEL